MSVRLALTVAFLLGLLTRRRVTDRANVAAMIVMALVNLILLGLSESRILPFAWSWLVILGTAGTMLIAVVLSAFSSGGKDAARQRSDAGIARGS